MNTAQVANVFGFIAAGIGIIMFVPQAVQVWRTKNTKSISLVSFALLGCASIFWIVYGLLLTAAPIILVNVVVLALSSYIVLMKIKHG